MLTREILSSHPVTTLRKEISKTNIKGYSSMKKPEIIELMMKHKERFGHIQMKGKSAPAKKPERKPKNIYTGEMLKQSLEKEKLETKIKQFGEYGRYKGSIMPRAGIILKEPINYDKILNFLSKNKHSDLKKAITYAATVRLRQCEKNIYLLKLAIKLKKKEITFQSVREWRYKTKKSLMDAAQKIKTACFTKEQVDKILKLDLLPLGSLKGLKRTIKEENELINEFKK